MSTEKEKKATHAVIYTDGGCRPASRGIGGWGIHGYMFYPEEAKQGTGCPKALPSESGYLMGESGKPKITLTGYVDGFGALLPESTNNIAELMANFKALQVAKEHGIQNLHLVMDSQYVLQGFDQWLPKWAANNWVKADQQPVANAEIWKQVYAAKLELQEAGVTMTTAWIKGHSGHLGNELADVNATRGVIAGRNGHEVDQISISDNQGYWNTKTPRSRMFSHSNWYFGTQSGEGVVSADSRHIYYLGDPREEDELLGKKISDATFSVLYLKEPEPVLAKVREGAAALGTGRYQGLMIANLSELFKSGVYAEIEQYGDKLLSRDFHRQRLFSPTDTLLVKEASPARLAYNAIAALENLEGLLKEYLNPSANTRLRTTDLTGLLYESDTAKKKAVIKLKSHVTSAFRSFDVQANYADVSNATAIAKLTLTLGLDLPDRNTLAALATDDIKVTLLTWPESSHAIRFATVIEADGDAGIWSGIYANLHMLAS